MIHRTDPMLFQKSTSLWFKITLAIIASFILILIDARFATLQNVRKWVGYGLSPVQKTLAQVPQTITQVGSYGKSQLDLVAENQELHQKLTQERVRANQFTTLAAENEQLKSLLNLKQNSVLKTIVAEVFYGNRHPFAQRVLINKGQQEGVQVGQVVLNEIGLVGQVIRVYTNYAEVNLITQKDHTIPVKLHKNNENSILVGLGQPNALELRFMNINSAIVKGDLISTSGLDEIYPAGIPVAQVESVQNNNDSFLKVTAKPLATNLSERYVMILQNHNIELTSSELLESSETPKPAAKKHLNKTPDAINAVNTVNAVNPVNISTSLSVKP
jgi:rod shape-determining protein MreC